jgi:hypothetical protein
MVAMVLPPASILTEIGKDCQTLMARLARLQSGSFECFSVYARHLSLPQMCSWLKSLAFFRAGVSMVGASQRGRTDRRRLHAALLAPGKRHPAFLRSGERDEYSNDNRFREL